MNIHASFARKPRLTPKILVDRDPTNAVYYDPVAVATEWRANRALASVTLTNCISCYRHTQRQPPEWSGARFDGQTAPTCFTNPRAGHGWGIGDRRSAGDV